MEMRVKHCELNTFL